MQRVPTKYWDVAVVNFFFQAEDGIRDIGVTGVQTCALPIYERSKFQLRNLGRAAWSLSSNWSLTSNKLLKLATAIFAAFYSRNT